MQYNGKRPKRQTLLLLDALLFRDQIGQLRSAEECWC
jgi:hypothetical protein